MRLFKLPAMDVNEQNSRMHNGEKSQKDIERHAAEWIKSHQTTWNTWMREARKAAM